MADDFKYDLFLSHSAKDKAVVRALAERLRKDGLKVWFDEWVLKAGDSIPAKIEEGLEHSRVLVLCMSASAFGSDWAQLEAGTFRFRDPLNKERRFIPVRLDDAPIKGSLAQFLYINWSAENRENEHAKLLDGCRALITTPSEVHVSPECASDQSIGKHGVKPTDLSSWHCLSVWDKYEELRGRFYEREEFVKAIVGQRMHGSGLLAEVKTMGQHIDVRMRIGGERRIGIFLCCPSTWKTKLFALHHGDTVSFEGVSQEINGLGIVLTAESIDYEAATESASSKNK